MGVRVAYDSQHQVGVMYCSTTGIAFGPVFESVNARQEIEDFLAWLKENEDPVSWAVAVSKDGDGTDPRHYDDGELERIVNHWREVQECVGEEPDGSRYLGGGNVGSTSR
jgi:hypothetical protein